MKVFLNKESIEIDSNKLIILLQETGFAEKTGIAVALNDMVVPRSKWETKKLSENDQVTVITATAGG